MLCGLKQKLNWDETIQSSALIHYSVGPTAYEILRQIGYPFASSDAISKRLDLDFRPGVLECNFKLLKAKANKKPEEYKECCLVMDELKIQPKFEYDYSTKSLSGYVTVPRAANSKKVVQGDDDEVAQDGLVYMLVGLKERWKVVIGYDFTSGSFHGQVVAGRIRKIIEIAHMIELDVLMLLSDMGPCNQGV